MSRVVCLATLYSNHTFIHACHHSPTHAPTHSLTPPLTHPLTRSLPHSRTHSFTHAGARAHVRARSLTLRDSGIPGYLTPCLFFGSPELRMADGLVSPAARLFCSSCATLKSWRQFPIQASVACILACIICSFKYQERRIHNCLLLCCNNNPLWQTRAWIC